jgi:predicted aconitase with swiveling domain
VTSDSGAELSGRVLHPGSAVGELLVLDAPLSFWGGVDPSGRIVDAHHPQCGADLAGRVVAMRSGRGSSSSSSVLAEQIRAGSAPAALLLGEPDMMVTLGAIVAAELYGTAVPIVQVAFDRVAELASAPGQQISVDAPAIGPGTARAVGRGKTA